MLTGQQLLTELRAELEYANGAQDRSNARVVRAALLIRIISTAALIGTCHLGGKVNRSPHCSVPSADLVRDGWKRVAADAHDCLKK